MADSASTVPPFIPGLLIVSLLITISVVVAWRNYTRRGNPRLTPGVNSWDVWDESGTGRRGGRSRLERPKMWEVDIGGSATKLDEGDEGGWEQIMPLSATSLAPEPPPRLTLDASHDPSPSSSPTLPEHRLQVSVLIAMPSPHRFQPQPNFTSEEYAPRQSTSSSVWKERDSVNGEEEDCPEVALGIAVLPWQKDEDEDEDEDEERSAGETNVPVT